MTKKARSKKSVKAQVAPKGEAEEINVFEEPVEAQEDQMDLFEDVPESSEAVAPVIPDIGPKPGGQEDSKEEQKLSQEEAVVVEPEAPVVSKEKRLVGHHPITKEPVYR